MKYRVRVQTFFNRLRVRYRESRDFGLAQTCALIRKQARESMRVRPGPSKPGRPPHAHRRAGLKEINFDIRGNRGIIGPRKFRTSTFFNRPVPNIQEIGGTAIGTTLRKRAVFRYPERSYMWRAVKTLQNRGKIASRFIISMRSKF